MGGERDGKGAGIEREWVGKRAGEGKEMKWEDREGEGLGRESRAPGQEGGRAGVPSGAGRAGAAAAPPQPLLLSQRLPRALRPPRGHHQLPG